MAAQRASQSPSEPLRSSAEAKRVPHLHWTDFRFEKKVAAGATAEVWLAVYKPDEAQCAVKSYTADKLDNARINSLCRETAISWLLSAGSPLIVKCWGFSVVA